MDIENQLIVKYLMQRLTEEESALVAEWIKNDESNQDFLFSLEELYWANRMEEMQRLADTNQEWKKLEYQILHGREKRKEKKHRKKFSSLTAILKYAAIIAVSISLPFMAFQMGFFNKTEKQNLPSFITVVTGKGERSQLILPDGTKVWMNACSSLKYNTGLSSGRQLQLTGEAYFEVAKDEHRPFIVSTPLLDVKVLGTKFNLKAFEGDDKIQATLYEGLIAANTHDQSFKKDFFLNPGEQLIYKKDKTLVITTLSCTDAIDWKNGIFRFNKQTLQDIAHSLERSFDAEITIMDANLAQEKFTCEFKNEENLIDILNILKRTKKLDYAMKGSKVNIISKNKNRTK
jgi:ferric-dicitrate binding protein FerR (iron transport regulator)